MQKILVITSLVALAACGGSNRASGDISKACIAADRKAASSSLCSCIQRVADQELTSSDQRRAAKFFDDPHLAQETRQSDNAGSERFWLRYKAFSVAAGRSCG
jgi:hypothetical protein